MVTKLRTEGISRILWNEIAKLYSAGYRTFIDGARVLNSTAFSVTRERESPAYGVHRLSFADNTRSRDETNL